MSKKKTSGKKTGARQKKPTVVRYLSFELREFRKIANPASFRSFFFIMLILLTALPAIAFGCYAGAWIVYGGMNAQSASGNGYVYMGAFAYFRTFLFSGLVLLAGVLLYLLFFPRGIDELKRLCRREPWHFLLLFLLLWSVPGLLLSENPMDAWTGSPFQYDGLRTYLIMAAVYLAACFLPGLRRRLVILRVFTTACTFCTLLMFGQIYKWPIVYDCLFHTPSSVTVNLNHFGYLLCTSIPLLAGLALYDRGKKRTIWYEISFAFQVLGLLFNDTFGCYLAAAFGLGALALFHWKSRRTWASYGPRLVLLAAVFLLISIGCYFDIIQSPTGRKFSRNFSQFSSDVSSFASGAEVGTYSGGSGRLRLWKEALKLIPEHPLAGFGPNGMPDGYDPIKGLTRPHNTFIQIAVFHGIPGAAAYIAALVFLLLRKWKELENLDDSVLISAGGTAAYLFSSFFGVPMFYTSPYLFLLLGFDSTPERREPLLSDADSDTPAVPPPLSGKTRQPLVQWKRLIPLVACILVVAGIAAFVFEQYLERQWERQDVILMELAFLKGQETLRSDGLTEVTRLWYEPDADALVSAPVPPAYGAGTKLRGYRDINDLNAHQELLPYDAGTDYSSQILEVELDPAAGSDGVTVRWVPAA